MAQIKLGQETKPNSQEELKHKQNLRAAIRLAQKEQQEIIQHLNEFHNPQAIQEIQYDQQKTQLQKFLDIPSNKRSKKMLKGLKGQLSYLSCFQVQTQTEMPKQLLAIMKRDIQMLIAVISPFVYAKIYPKGSIIQSVTNQRDSVKVLLQGEVAIYEPLNYKSYKNCAKISKEGKINSQWLKQIIQSFNITHKNQHFYHDQNQQELAVSCIHFNPQDIKQEVEHNLRKKLKPLSIQLSKRILTYSNIISPMTPHRQTKMIKQQGMLIASQRQPFVVNQPKIYQHTSICLTETYVLQLQYDVYKASISLLNSDEEKLFIQILLKKFQMFEYFDAKQYVKKQFMIDRLKEEKEEEKHENLQAVKNENQDQTLIITSPLNPTQKILKKRTKTDHSELKSEKNSKSSISSEEIIETFDIKYEGDIYLIISGEVTLIIDKITQNRPFPIEHSSKIKTFKEQKVIKLYSMDIFGFQEIGKIKEYNLRFRVNKQSKLLLFNENVYIKHFSEIQGFRQFFKNLQKERNQLLNSILKNISNSINQEMGRIYQSISKILPEKSSPKISKNKKSTSVLHSNNLVKKVEYIGNIEFQSVQNKIKDKLLRQKQGAQSNLNFKQMIKSGQQLKDSLSFASEFKKNLPKNCEIVGDYIQIRDSKGNLKRKKHIGESHEGQQRKQSLIFRKLGIISDKDRNDHNFALVSNRKSKYELGDFGKQKKEMERLKQIAHSLPRLNYYYAKKQEILYKNIHKRDY